MIDQTPTIGALATALALAQADIENAAKDANNPHFNKKYADLASIWNACRVPLSKNGLAVHQGCTADGAKVTVSTTLMHKSGEYITSALSITAQQNTPQAIGSAITYARRYALAAAVGVAPEEDDGNAAQGRADIKTASPAPRDARPPEPTTKERHEAACSLIKKKLGEVKGTVEIGKIKDTLTKEGKSKMEILEYLEGFAGAPISSPDKVPF